MTREALTFAKAVHWFESSRVNGALKQLEDKLPDMQTKYDTNRAILDELGIVGQLETAALNYQSVTGKKARVVPSERPYIGRMGGSNYRQLYGFEECEISFLFEPIDEESITYYMSVGADNWTLRVRTDTLVGTFQADQLDIIGLDHALFEAYTNHGTRDRKPADFL